MFENLLVQWERLLLVKFWSSLHMSERTECYCFCRVVFWPLWNVFITWFTGNRVLSPQKTTDTTSHLASGFRKVIQVLKYTEKKGYSLSFGKKIILLSETYLAMNIFVILLIESDETLEILVISSIRQKKWFFRSNFSRGAYPENL